jgi:hypothetical protein
MVKFYQHNLRKCRTATEILIKQLGECKDSFICLIQEPYTYKSKIRLFPNQAKVYSTDHPEGPRACIVSSQDMDLWVVPKFTGRDITTCLWQTKKGRVYLSSVYCDILYPPISEELESLTDFCRISKKELVLGLDTNAHSSLWGC